jgi:hypothetical protein
MVHSLGARAARQLVTIGWVKPRKRKSDATAGSS